MNDEQMEFDFGPQACNCSENTSYDDLCPVCLADCLEWMADNEELDYEEYA